MSFIITMLCSCCIMVVYFGYAWYQNTVGFAKVWVIAGKVWALCGSLSNIVYIWLSYEPVPSLYNVCRVHFIYVLLDDYPFTANCICMIETGFLWLILRKTTFQIPFIQRSFFGAQGGSHTSHINPKSSPNLD